MKRVLFFLLLGAQWACASNYYVDCNYGSNGNAGTSPQQAWRTLLQVGISYVSARRHHQLATGLHLERDSDSTIEREQWIVDQD